MSNKSSVLYLYSELMGYQIPVFKELLNHFDEIHVVHWDRNKKTTYSPPLVNGVKYYDRSTFNVRRLIRLINLLKPELLYISGWMDRGYLCAAFYARWRNYIVVTMFDDVWYSTMRQQIGRIIFPLFRNLFFSHAWVSGYFQYDFARKLGFSKDKIIVSALSADVESFSKIYSMRTTNSNWLNSKRILYVGRFSHEKGLDTLLGVWRSIVNDGLSDGWSLTFIGSGPIQFSSLQSEFFYVKPFLNPEDLVLEVADYTCFILPSLKEPWGLVVHEFSVAGFPIVCSNNCGAAQHFVIDGFNGFKFPPANAFQLKNSILQIINSDIRSLRAMSERSHLLSKSITPSISAAQLCSLLKK
jgi:glycosyltransferase involved in cell wall biosynthesis